MQWRLSCIDASERDLIIESAFAVLERVGMRMPGAHTVAALQERGALVDHDTDTVRMPEEMVRAALESLPDQLFIAGATSAQDVVLDRRSGPYFNPAGCMAKTLDHRTGELRPSDLRDLREGTMVMDATPEIDVMWTFVSANDVPVERRELVEYYTYLTHTAKPLVCVDCPTEVEAVRRIMEILGDGPEGYRRRPRLGVLCAARAPLEVNGGLLDTTCKLAALGSPVWIYTMPISGATSPITMGGTLAIRWAEVLGLTTAVQAVAPGAAVLACCGPGVLDMRTSSMSLGCPENTMMAAVSVEIGHHLGLPVHNPGQASDAKHPGLQAGYEKGTKALAAALAGADLISAGFGALAASSVFHLPMVAVDAEIARLVKRIVAGVEVSAETVMLEAIERVGVGGNYLKERATRERVRAGEHFMPVIGSRLPFEQWMAEGRIESDEARDRVDHLLAEAEKDARVHEGGASLLTADQLRALAEVCGVVA